MDSKSKKELYLERLQKWKEEKQKEKENRQAILSAKKPKLAQPQNSTKKLPVQTISKPTVQSARKPLLTPANRADSKSRPEVKTSSSTTNRPIPSLPKSGTKNSTKTATVKSESKVSVVKSEQKLKTITSSQPSLIKATNDFNKKDLAKTTNGSAQQCDTKAINESTKKDVTKTTNDSTQQSAAKSTNESSKYKFVRSRLFDFQSKQKPQSAVKNEVKDGKITSTTISAKTGQDKPAIVRPEVGKALKRRHSVVSGSEVNNKKAKKPGILKRKSCYGSLDITKRSHASLDMPCLDIHSDEGSGDEVFQDSTTNNPPVAAVTPGSTRNVRFISPDVSSPVDSRLLRKTPAVRRTALNDWLKAKGKTPSKFRHLMCFHGDYDGSCDGGAVKTSDSLTKCSLTVDELSEQLEIIKQEQILSETKAKLNTMLEECMTLYEAGCPSDAILPWLDDIAAKIPYANSSAVYYKCRAEVIKSTLDLDAVLEVFEQATINNAQPGAELAKCLTETIKFVTEEKVRQARSRVRTPRRSEVQPENIFESSRVAYSVTEATPLSASKKRSSSKKRASTGGALVQVVTPVRRSTRRSLQCLPDSLKEKTETFYSLQEVQDKQGDNLLFHPNLALDSILAVADD